MPELPFRIALVVSVGCAVLVGCTDPASRTAGPEAPRASPAIVTTGAPDLDIVGLTNEFGTAVVSMDSADQSYQPLYWSDEVAGNCREHFQGVSLYWSGPNGIVIFDLLPPLLFVQYRGGTYLGALKAIYENVGDVDSKDDAGYTWRFHGRFNALCRNLDRQVGPVIIQAQFLTAQDPIDTPRLMSTGAGGGTGSCDYQIIGDPSTCTDTGGGGGGPDGGDPSGGSPSGGGGPNLCVDLQLTPGCYDVYVDGSYDGQVCC